MNALLALTCALAPQAARADFDPSGVTYTEALDAHFRAVALERRREVQRRWQVAGVDARDAARDVFRRAARQGVSATWTSDVDVLTLAWRALADGARDSPEQRALGRMAGAIDLRATPGAFEVPAGEALERGVPITVQGSFLRSIARGETSDEDGDWIDTDLALLWVAPDGTEQVARREPLGPGALGVPGFEMYVRSPLVAGDWRLVPRLEREGTVARGYGVPVEGIPDLRAGLKRLADAPGVGDEQRVAVAMRYGSGMRFAALETLAPVLDDPSSADWPRRESSADGLLGWRLDPEQGTAVRGVVLVAAPRGEDPLWLFTEEGRGWHELARSGFVVASSRLDLLSGALAAYMQALAAEHPGSVRILVLRGDRVGELELLGRGPFEPFFERLVASVTFSAGRRPRRLAACPALVVQPLAEASGEEQLGPEGEPPLTWVRTPDPPLMADRALPGRLSSWLRL